MLAVGGIAAGWGVVWFSQCGGLNPGLHTGAIRTLSIVHSAWLSVQGGEARDPPASAPEYLRYL